MKLLCANSLCLCLLLACAGCVSTSGHDGGQEYFPYHRVRGILLRKSAVPSPSDRVPFASHFAEALYEDSEGRFVIRHWCIVNGVPSQAYAALKIGRTYQFAVVRFKDVEDGIGNLSGQTQQVGLWTWDSYGTVSDIVEDTLNVSVDRLYYDLLYVPNTSLQHGARGATEDRLR